MKAMNGIRRRRFEMKNGQKMTFDDVDK